jgi:FkbM family methyltransferase
MNTAEAQAEPEYAAGFRDFLHRGSVFWVRADRAEQDIGIVREVFDHDFYELGFLRFLLPEVRVVLDIGGHIGAFGMLAKRYWPRARLIAFEPNPVSCALYRRNIESNKLRDAEVLCEAVSYDPARTVLMDGRGSTGGCVLMSAEQASAMDHAATVPGQEKYSILESCVRCTTVEQVISRFNLNDGIDLCKWDCEGSELPAFENMPRETAAQFRTILGEYHTNEGFEKFRELAERAHPHLKVFGGNGLAIGPFWGIDPKLARVAAAAIKFKISLRKLRRTVAAKVKR